MTALNVPEVMAAVAAARVATLAALQCLGQASVGELADALGITDAYERKKLRSRLVSWERQGLVRAVITAPNQSGYRLTAWCVVEQQAGSETP